MKWRVRDRLKITAFPLEVSLIDEVFLPTRLSTIGSNSPPTSRSHHLMSLIPDVVSRRPLKRRKSFVITLRSDGGIT